MDKPRGLTRSQFDRILGIKRVREGECGLCFSRARKTDTGDWLCCEYDDDLRYVIASDRVSTIQEAFQWIKNHRQDGELSLEIDLSITWPSDTSGDYYQKVLPYSEFGLA